MSFEIKVKAGKPDKGGPKKIGIDITQDGKPFYSASHTWTGIKGDDEARVDAILAPLLGSVGITPSGDGIIGPIEEDEMIAFEVGLTSVSKQLNEFAIEDAKGKGRTTTKAEAALSQL